jgi:hypothetical protein
MAAAYPHKSVTVAQKRLADSSPLHFSALLRDEEIGSFSIKKMTSSSTRTIRGTIALFKATHPSKAFPAMGQDALRRAKEIGTPCLLCCQSNNNGSGVGQSDLSSNR